MTNSWLKSAFSLRNLAMAPSTILAAISAGLPVSRAFSLAIVRSYNSLRGSELGPFGNGWTFNYNEKLVVNPDLNVTWNDGDGSQHIFTPKTGSGGYGAPRGITSRLVKNGDATFKPVFAIVGFQRFIDLAAFALTATNNHTRIYAYNGSENTTEQALYQRVNVEGTVNVLEAARRYGVRKLILASSSSVYGVNSKVPFSESDPIFSPISPYAASKLACEALGHVYHHVYGLDVVMLRFFTVYGPR